MNNKTTNKSIIKTLGILAILVFSLIAVMPAKAMADYNCGGVTYGNIASTSYTANCNNSNGTNTNNNNNYNNNTETNNQYNSVPIIYSITPNGVDLSTIVGNGNMAVILNGANFVPGSIAEFDNTYRNTTFNSSGQLTVILTAPDLAVAKSYVVTVFNPIPGGGNSNGVSFTIKTAIVAPSSVTSSSPSATPKTSKPKSSPTSADFAANSIFAANGFMPSNLLQWVMALILVIFIAIVARKAFGSANKYKNTPLKHA